MCNSYATESVEHMLCECDAYVNVRDKHMQKLVESMPLGMKHAFLSMDTREKVKFLLSGFNMQSLCSKWVNSYLCVMDYVAEVYKLRKEKAQALLEQIKT